MGIHICAYILTHQDIDEYTRTKYWVTEDYKPFDSLRHIGDKDFVYTEEIEFSFIRDDERSYRRPANIDQAIQWIKQHIDAECQARLIALMEAMRKDERLHLYIS